MPFNYPIEEVAGSPRADFTVEGLNVTREFLIYWENTNQFVDEMKLNGFYSPTSYPGFPWTFVQDISIDPRECNPTNKQISDPTVDVNDYNGKQVFVTVEYGPLDIDSPTTRRFSEADQDGVEKLCESFCALQEQRKYFI